MSNAKERLAKLGIHIPEILLPKKEISLEKWSVIACDQFTSEKDYWERCKTNAGGAPSTLNLILPECYLNEVDREQKTKEINQTMKDYRSSVLQPVGQGVMRIDRSTSWVKSRKGLVLALDLDAYEFQKGTKSLVRPTEATVVDRLPARIAVRREAVLDLPHILVLMDDKDNIVMEAAEKAAARNMYDFDLMEEGGHIRGEIIEEEQDLSALADAFETLNEQSSFLFAIGDGNHSLASAKEIWRKMKESGVTDHPARYALVELENIHDPGMLFHPIHRILFEVDVPALLKDMESALNAQVGTAANLDEIRRVVESDGNSFGCFDGTEYRILTIKVASDRLLAEEFHDFLDPWVEKNPCKEVDYIHGDESFKELSSPDGNVGFYLPSIDKNRFFDLVDKKGSLPRKTFSIGEAQEKRYYLESRSLSK